MGNRPTEPPEPPIVLRLGVTGHRRLDPEHLPAIRQRIADLFASIRRTLEEAAQGAAYQFIAVSPLAEGADQLVAEIALEHGCELQCPFPFFAEEYAKDFDAGSEAARRFDEYRGRATSVLELDGRRELVPNADGKGEHLSGSRSYERVGRVVLENSDLLLAVWDGAEARGRGGTAQIVAEAITAEIPTIVLPTNRPDDVHLRGQDVLGQPSRESIDELDRRVRELVRPEEAGARPAAQHDADIGTHMASQRACYRTYRDEDANVETLGWRLARAWWRFWTLLPFGIGGPGLRRKQQHSEPAYPPDPPDRRSPHRPSELKAYYKAHYDWASALANHYTKLYRASFVGNYVLGALAVSLALMGGIAHLAHLAHVDEAPTIPGVHAAADPAREPGAPPADPSPGHADHGAHGADQVLFTPAWWFALVEVVVILMILAVADRAKRGQWHRKSVDYRTLTEQLRTMSYLAPLGLGAPNTRPRPYVSDEGDLRANWPNWEFRRILRAAGLVDARFSDPYRRASGAMLGEWAEGQLEYHTRTAHRHEHAHHRHERWAFIFVLGALGACIAHLFPQCHAWAVILTALAAGLPALAAALHGIAGQAELERVAKRSEAMAQWLKSDLMEGRLHALARASGGDAPHGDALQVAARIIASQMIEEVNDWQVLHRAGDVKAT